MQLKNVLLVTGFLALGIGAGLGLGRYAPSLFREAAPAPISQGDFLAEYIKPAGKPVVMFSMSTCTHCQKARTYFNEQGIAYAEYVIDQSADAKAAFDRMEEAGVPVILTATHKIRGFDPGLIASILEQDGVLQKVSSAQTVLDKAK